MKLQVTNHEFPSLSSIQDDTEKIIKYIAVGQVAVERGLALLWLVWRERKFLEIVETTVQCGTCGFVANSDETVCPRCGADNLNEVQMPVYPTVRSYVEYISEQTGRSAPTIWSRLSVYTALDNKGVNPSDVYRLNMLSPGAARELAKCDDDPPGLVNGSYQDTVVATLSMPSRKDALDFVRHDVLRKPKITARADNDNVIVVEKEDPGDDLMVIQKATITINSGDDDIRHWIFSRLHVRGDK